MFIQTETTPNPATLKFLPGKEVLREGTADFRDAASAAEASPLAGRLFAIDGVTGVFFGYDFVTVTKDGPDWQHLKPAILGAIMEHFMSGAPVMAHAGPALETSETDEFYDKADEELVLTIKELLDTREGILRLRGQWLAYDTGKRQIRAMATLHPAYLLRQPLQKLDVGHRMRITGNEHPLRRTGRQ